MRAGSVWRWGMGRYQREDERKVAVDIHELGIETMHLARQWGEVLSSLAVVHITGVSGRGGEATDDGVVVVVVHSLSNQQQFAITQREKWK